MAQLMKGETWADAQKLVKGKPRFEYPVWVEAKADEIRCRVLRRGAHIVQFDSYAEKPLHNLGFLQNKFLHFFDASGYTELDIGILVNENFNDSYRWVRSSKGYPKEKYDRKTGRTAPELFEHQVHVIVFDMPESTQRFEDRLEERRRVRDLLLDVGIPASVPIGQYANNAAGVLQMYGDLRLDGYEGAMAKTLDHLYSRTRTFDWMKIKPKETFDGRITGFNEAVSEEGVPLGRVGSVNVACEDGSTASPAGFKHAHGRALWAARDSLVGQWIEFEAMERDRQGGYRHPIYCRFREDKA